MKKKFFKGTNDNMFKAIFTPKKNRELLKEFIKRSLRTVLNSDLEDLVILSSEIAKTNVHIKGKTVDVLAETKNEVLNIELNNSYYPSLHNRNASYIFSKYSEEVKVSETYNKMKMFIQINLTKGLSKDYPSLDIYTLKGEKTNKKYIDNLIILEFNIDKIKDEWYNGGNEFNFVAALDLEGEELDKICEGDKYMELFEKEVKRLNQNQKFMELFEKEVKRLNQNQKFTEFMSAKEEEEKLKKTLIEDAKKEGKIEIAKNMLENKMDVKLISKLTELSISEIETLK